MSLKFIEMSGDPNWKQHVKEEETRPSIPSGRWRYLLNRALMLYGGLFFGVSILLSLLGVDPLIHNGVVPKGLLVYVGLAVILAWASSEAQRADEPAAGWFTRLGKWRL